MADPVVQVVLVVAALLAALGYRYRFAAPVAAVLYLYWQCLGQSWGEMKHARVTLVLGPAVPVRRARRAAALGRLVAGRGGARAARPEASRRTPDDEPSRNGAWAVRAIQVALAALYFLSGYSKLRAVGIDWIWGDTLRQAIQDKASSGETTDARLLGAAPRVDADRASRRSSLVWEVCFPLVFFRRLRYPVLIVGLLFNIGLWTTVKIEFFGVVACFAAFLPLEEYEQAVRRRLRSASDWRSPLCPATRDARRRNGGRCHV